MSVDFGKFSVYSDFELWHHNIGTVLFKRNLWATIHSPEPVEEGPKRNKWLEAQQAAYSIVQQALDDEVIALLEPVHQRRSGNAVQLLTSVQCLGVKLSQERRKDTLTKIQTAKYSDSQSICEFVEYLNCLHGDMDVLRSPFSDQDKARILRNALPVSRDRKYCGLKTAITSCVVMRVPYFSICEMVIEDVQRIQREAVIFADPPGIVDQEEEPRIMKKFPPPKKGIFKGKFNPKIKHCDWCGRVNHLIKNCTAKATYERRNKFKEQKEKM